MIEGISSVNLNDQQKYYKNNTQTGAYLPKAQNNPDTVEIKNNEEKTSKLKKYGKIAAGVAIAALAAAGIILGKKKIDIKKAERLNADAQKLADETRVKAQQDAKKQAEELMSEQVKLKAERKAPIKPEKEADAKAKPEATEKSRIKAEGCTQEYKILSKYEAENPAEVTNAMSELRGRPYDYKANFKILELNDSEYKTVSIELKENGTQIVTYIDLDNCFDFGLNPKRLIRKTYDRSGKEQKVLIIRPKTAELKDSEPVDMEIFESINGSKFKPLSTVEETAFGEKVKKEFTSFNGTKTQYERTTTLNGYTLSYKITDKDGKVIMDEARTFEKLDENHTRTILKDFVYETEYNAANITVKKMDKKGALLDIKTLDMGGEGYLYDHYFTVPSNIIGNHQLDKELSSLYKKIEGDALYTIADKGVKIRYGEPTQQNGCYINYLNTIFLDKTKKENSYCLLHELGHAIDYTNGKSIQENPKLTSILKNTDKTYRNNTGINDNLMYMRYILIPEESAAETYPILSGQLPDETFTMRSNLFQMEFADYIAEYKNILQNHM